MKLDLLAPSLSQPPVRAGDRLRSERELAAVLNCNRMAVRRALTELVRQGLLVRKHGSGTYVRKVPQANPGDHPNRELIGPEFLLADDTRDRLAKTARIPNPLHFGLWTDLGWISATHQLMIAGLTNRAGETGNILSVHSITDKAEKLMAEARLKSELQRSPCDGYVVLDWCADLFLKAIGKPVPPITFFGGYVLLEHGPTILIECEKTLDRMIAILVREGFKRIAMVADGSCVVTPSEKFWARAYEQSISRAGLAYRGQAVADLNHNDTADVVQRLLSGRPRPDAITVTNDYLMQGVADALQRLGLQPGRDIGVITLSVRGGHKLPDGSDWSRMEADAELFGRIVFDSLLEYIQNSGVRRCSISIHPAWVPGETHRKTQRVSLGTGRRRNDT